MKQEVIQQYETAIMNNPIDKVEVFKKYYTNITTEQNNRLYVCLN